MLDVTCDGEKLNFKRTKSKEMIAYLIDRNGADVSSKEIAAALWADGTKENNRNYFHQLLFDVRQALEKVGAGDIKKTDIFIQLIQERFPATITLISKLVSRNFRVII